jgi:hypothetical protein
MLLSIVNDTQSTVMTNFIFAALSDNDYGSLLQAAVYYVETEREVPLTADEFKEWVLDHMVFQSAVCRIHPMFKQSPEDLAHTREYLSRNLTITYVLFTCGRSMCTCGHNCAFRAHSALDRSQ